jgi:NADPH-dependent curcumin reductase CurA
MDNSPTNIEAPARHRAWFVDRPIRGVPGPDDFRLIEEDTPRPAEGQLLVRTIYISIAPGVRPLLPYASDRPDVAGDSSTGRKDASKDHVPNPMQIRVGERMRSGIVPAMSAYSGGAVGQVVESHAAGFAAGDYVFGGLLWQEYEVLDAPAVLKLDPAVLPIEADLTLVGRSSFTGWVGYRRFCDAKAGETMVVSAAAGAVGMLVVQMAKADGLRVVGIVSGADKCRFVTEKLGADACIDRTAEDIGEALDRLLPEGVDIYFDNVAGRTQLPVFNRLKPFGRLIVCGMAAEYNGVESSTLPTGMILAKRLRIHGFVVLDHEEDYAAFRSDVARLWKEGKLIYKHQLYPGIESAPQALADCLTGANGGGKILVRVSPDTSKG